MNPAGVLVDMTGQRFGRWTVTHRVSPVGEPQPKWHVVCDCGTERDVPGGNLRQGVSQSCGCLARELHSQRQALANTTHGQTGTPTWNSWSSMLARCNRKTHHAYALYGGRGVTVCARWHSFEAFLADMGPRPRGKTLDRIDPDGNYEPGNCRWATPMEQRHNRRDSK